MNAEFAPLRLEPAYRKVATALLDRITDRSFSVGDRLPAELELARQFGVNRSTVREALRELESSGMLRRQRGSKLMMVSRPGREVVAGGVSRALALHDVSVLNVWEALTIIEPSIAEAAASRRRDADLAAVGAIARLDTLCSISAAARQAADFFRCMGEASHNPVLMLSHEPLLQLLEPSLETVIDQVPQARARIRSAQKRIIAAVEERDVDAAGNWTAKHIRDYRRGFDVAGIDLSTPVR